MPQAAEQWGIGKAIAAVVIVGVGVVCIWRVVANPGQRPDAVVQDTLSHVVAIPPPPPPAVDPQAARDAAHAAYIRDRDAMRKAKPKTEADATKLIGRQPDNIMDLPNMTMVQWYYEDKDVGRDVIQVSTASGKVTTMTF